MDASSYRRNVYHFVILYRPSKKPQFRKHWHQVRTKLLTKYLVQSIKLLEKLGQVTCKILLLLHYIHIISIMLKALTQKCWYRTQWHHKQTDQQIGYRQREKKIVGDIL